MDPRLLFYLGSLYLGCPAEFTLGANGKTGRTVFLNVSFVTPAKDAYQAAAAVATPNQPAALVDARVGEMEVGDGQEDEGNREQDEHQCHRAGHPK